MSAAAAGAAAEKQDGQGGGTGMRAGGSHGGVHSSSRAVHSCTYSIAAAVFIATPTHLLTHRTHSLTRPSPTPPHLVVLPQGAQGGAVASHPRGACLAVPDGKVDDEHVLGLAKALLQVGQHTARGELQEQRGEGGGRQGQAMVRQCQCMM